MLPTSGIGLEYDVFGMRGPAAMLDDYSLPPTARRLGHKPRVERDQVPPATIVLITDGEHNTGVPASIGTELAAELGVRVLTVGVGTAGGSRSPVGFDDTSLKHIAATTGGRYFALDDARALGRVAGDLLAHVGIKSRAREIGPLLIAVALVLIILAALLSLHWGTRLSQVR